MNADAAGTNREVYHFIGYVPLRGKVGESNGLKSGPDGVGELPSTHPPSGSGKAVRPGWVDVVRPVLRMKMRKYGGGEETGGISFNLLAIVKDQLCRVSDQLEL